MYIKVDTLLSVYVSICSHNLREITKSKMHPHDRFRVIFDHWIKKTTSFVGCDIFATNFRATAVTVIVCIFTFLGFFSSFYTFLAFDVEVGLQCIVQVCIFGQVKSL